MCSYTHARRDYDIEIEGLKRETLRAQEEHERLVAVRDRLESDRVFVEEQLTKTKVRSVYSMIVGLLRYWYHTASVLHTRVRM